MPWAFFHLHLLCWPGTRWYIVCSQYLAFPMAQHQLHSVCCDSCRKESDMTERLNWTELNNAFAGQEATGRTIHGTTDWFQIGKGVHQGCILPPCLYNFYAEYIMRNAGLEEAQAGIKIARRNINNLRYADNTTLMTESEEELKTLLMKVKGEWKSWLKAQHSENEDHSIRSYHFMGNRWGNSGNSVRFYFSGLQNHCRWWLQPWN